MIESTRQNYKLIAILISTIAAGIPLWTHSGRAINFTDTTFILTWVAIGIVASFVALFVVNLKTKDMISSFIIGYMVAVITYFVSRILISNMIHTQFVISLALAIGVGAFSGWVGSLFWSKAKTKNRNKKKS
ncbi:hypothetical protein [Rhodohalobacter halophilus]|uniref:hypothetical protein n=1 Tax=Rhodohalobacter halophilus TaxID=1812810 RepID=UPI00083FA1E3|nr:hypothetical protein [Rhodohalobacter halophilus]